MPENLFFSNSWTSLILNWCCISLSFNLNSVSLPSLVSFNFFPVFLASNWSFDSNILYSSSTFCSNICKVVQIKFLSFFHTPEHWLTSQSFSKDLSRDFCLKEISVVQCFYKVKLTAWKTTSLVINNRNPLFRVWSLSDPSQNG